MSEYTIRELFRSVERTLQERLQCIEEVILRGGAGNTPNYMVNPNATVFMANGSSSMAASAAATQDYGAVIEDLQRKVVELSAKVEGLQKELRAGNSLLPVHPMEGIELIPKREIVLPMTQLSVEDRLLLNKKARKALEAEEMGERVFEDYSEMAEEESVIGNEGDEEVQVNVVKSSVGTVTPPVEAVEEEAVEEEAVEEEAVEEEAVEEEAIEEEAIEEEDAEEAVELEEFEYKGATYYRDSENNVYMTDEDGELMDEPIGVWSEVKKRIVVKKQLA